MSLKHILRKSALYLVAVVVAGGVPLSITPTHAAEQKKRNYTYNSTTGHWDTDKWRWDPVQKRYVRVTTPSPSPASTPTPSPEATTDTEDEAEESAATVSNADVDPEAVIATDVDVSTNTDITNDADVTNALDSDAKTGNADVVRNTKAGDAKTGDASAVTTVVNSVHSTVGNKDDASGVAHFTIDLYGDIVGDITLGPAIDNATIKNDVDISDRTNVQNNTSLANNLSLDAKSGDATVSGNTKAGSAKSGDANAVANVLNLINTIVAANKSFIGTINIHGNLNGDILVSPEFIPQLLASNAEVYGNFNMPLSTTVNDDKSIVNNVKLNATTGDATVANNTSAGSAKTGAAETNLTILNLTGHEVDASKSLLVFVNVLGKWVGMIVDAPNATAAALGSGVVKNNVNISSDTNVNNNASIVNNIDLTAASGDATVTGNTQAGDAVSGDATASANIANISTSTLNLTDWFGVLYINVFGEWIGSFGIDTIAGKVFPLKGDVVPKPQTRAAGAPNLQFGFVPQGDTTTVAAAKKMTPKERKDKVNALLASAGVLPPTGGTYVPAPRERQVDPISIAMMVVGFTVAGAYATRWGASRWLSRRQTETVPGLVIHRE